MNDFSFFSCEVGKSENTFSTTVSRPRAPPHEWLFFPYIRREIQKHVFDKFRQISPFRHISPNFDKFRQISTNFAFFDKFRQLDRFRHHFSQIRQFDIIFRKFDSSTSFFANSTELDKFRQLDRIRQN